MLKLIQSVFLISCLAVGSPALAKSNAGSKAKASSSRSGTTRPQAGKPSEAKSPKVEVKKPMDVPMEITIDGILSVIKRPQIAGSFCFDSEAKLKISCLNAKLMTVFNKDYLFRPVSEENRNNPESIERTPIIRVTNGPLKVVVNAIQDCTGKGGAQTCTDKINFDATFFLSDGKQWQPAYLEVLLDTEETKDLLAFRVHSLRLSLDGALGSIDTVTLKLERDGSSATLRSPEFSPDGNIYIKWRPVQVDMNYVYDTKTELYRISGNVDATQDPK